MKKKILSLLLTLSLAVSALCLSAFAALPDGWWPVWSAYAEAIESGADDDTLLQRGDAVINFYAKYERNAEIANQLFTVYRDRLNRSIFENRGDWDKAIANTKLLAEICRYQIGIGNEPAAYGEWLPRCDAHLTVLEPFAGVYAASYTRSDTRGSRVAPASGVLYGTPLDGCYSDGSIFSCYVELELETAKDYAGLIEAKLNGKRALLLNLNFKGEGDTARAIPSGAYDSSLRETLRYLAGLNSPVLLRIGAEPNVWSNTVTPQDYIAAYNYVASMARSLAPKVELVWSPNFASGWKVRMADFYPADTLVDWVGVSLYYCYENSGDSKLEWLEYVHAGRFADPVANCAEAAELARAKGKPLIVTEGGTVEYGGIANYKANQVAKEFSTLAMVYPEIKAMLYFDQFYNGEDYRLTGASKAAADAAIAANPALLAAGESAGATFVPAESFHEKPNGALLLGASGRTYRSNEMSAVWSLDGSQIASVPASPCYCRVDTAALAAGKHRLEITLRDSGGFTLTKTYTLTREKDGTVQISAGWSGGEIASASGKTPFADVPADAYYEDAVLWALNNGVTRGMSESRFGSDLTVTRAQAVTFLWRAMGMPEPRSAANPFADVSAEDYFFKSVLWAVENGITNGTGAQTFSPDATCTRASIITFLYRTQGEPGKTGAGEWYGDAVRWAEQNGLLAGTAEAFSPNTDCPRKDVVTYLYRALAR